MKYLSRRFANRSGLSNAFLKRHAGLARTLARTCIGARALTAHRQTLAMAHSAVATEVDQALDRQLNLPPQVSLDREARNRLANALEFAVGEFLDLLRIGNPDGVQDCPRAGASESEDRSQADFSVLLGRNIDACYPCHFDSLCGSAVRAIIPDAACDADPCRSRAPPACVGSPCTFGTSS